MKKFKLPDLGEGLQEGEIVSWHVNEGDRVTVDQTLVSVETDKAVVELPSPFTGTIAKLCAAAGDIVPVGNTLVEFEAEDADAVTGDKGTVVGDVEVSANVVEEKPEAVGSKSSGVKATPAVRALAKRHKIDLSVVTPSGPNGVITKGDIERVAKIFAEVGPLEPLRGVRRVMAANMARANAEVVPVTVMDEADINDWAPDADITARLIRALVQGCQAEPSLNSWYDAESVGRRLLSSVHLGIAVDTSDGLFVPVIRDVQEMSPQQIRDEITRLRKGVKDRSLAPEELRGHTITLSNFGMIAGRFANPIVMPPTVAILGAGKIHEAVVAHEGKPAVRRHLPLSLTFDHRAIMGGEACRFLAAVIADLAKVE
tara:strand:- start:8298 stop:9410 length:1113 start_codon:yes stop_codon:yes gene_type:complete